MVRNTQDNGQTAVIEGAHASQTCAVINITDLIRSIRLVIQQVQSITLQSLQFSNQPVRGTLGSANHSQT